MPNPAVEATLDETYRRGSQIGTPLSETGLGHRGLTDFLDFLVQTVGRERFDGLSVLEIGSGGGAMLRALHRRGADVTGVEPGAEPDLDVPFRVLREPFRAELFGATFDLIVHHGVAEHIRDPTTFMTEQLSLLKPGGLIAFSVPDCALPLAHGDISMLVHEHWSYFTEDTLANVASLAGARVVHTVPAGGAGARYSVWANADEPAEANSSPAPSSFVERASGNLERLGDHLSGLRASGARLGIYCPGRFINYEALIGHSLPPLRYFDDDPLLEGLYYPPSSVPIESRVGLLSDPPTHVIVVSWTFGTEILRSLRSEHRLDGVEITTIASLLAS